MTKHNRSQLQIDSEASYFMYVVEELNKDYHDNCDKNTCKACIGK